MSGVTSSTEKMIVPVNGDLSDNDAGLGKSSSLALGAGGSADFSLSQRTHVRDQYSLSSSVPEADFATTATVDKKAEAESKIWDVPTLDATPYYPLGADESGKIRSKTLAQRVHVSFEKMADNTLKIKFTDEFVFEEPCYENNSKKSGSVNLDYQHGIHIAPSEIIKSGDAAPHDGSGRLVDQFGYVVDEEGYKLDEKNERAVFTNRYRQTRGTREKTFVLAPGQSFPAGEFVIRGEDDFDIKQIDSSYSINAETDEVKLHIVETDQVELTVYPVAPNAEPVVLQGTSAREQNLLYPDLRVKVDATFKTHKSAPKKNAKTGAETTTTTQVNHHAVLGSAPAQRSRDVKITERQIVSKEQTRTIRMIEVGKVPSILNAHDSLALLVEDETRSNDEAKTLIRSEIRLADFERGIDITQTKENNQQEVKSWKMGDIQTETRRLNPDGTTGDLTAPPVREKDKNNSGKSITVAVGAEVGYGQLSVGTERLVGYLYQPYLAIGAKSYLEQGGKADVFLASEIFVDGLGGSVYTQNETPPFENDLGLTMNGFLGNRVHFTLNVEEHKRSLWSFGVGGRFGFGLGDDQDSILKVGEPGYEARVIGDSAYLRIGGVVNAAFLNGAFRVYGGYEYSSGGDVPLHFERHAVTGNTVDFYDSLPVSGQQGMIGIALDPFKLFHSNKEEN